MPTKKVTKVDEVKGKLANMEFTKVHVPKRILDKRNWIKYLIVAWQDLAETITRFPDEKFNDFVQKEVLACAEGKTPPKEIASAIQNLVDDHLSGREVILRTGDYIVLQNYYKKTIHK